MVEPSPYLPLTVASALAEPVLRGARIVAGKRGLSRVVRSVGVLDVEDVAGVTDGQFVVSSAYPLLEADSAGLVDRLVRQSASALGIKTRGYWASMPADLCAAADALELPLLELPSGAFDDLVNPLLAAIADRQAEGLRRAAEVHEALARGVLAEVDLGAVVGTVARALGRPAAIVDEHGEILAARGDDAELPPQGIAEQAAALDGVGRAHADGADWIVAPISALGRFYGAVCALSGGADDALTRSALAEAATVSGMLLVGHRRVESVHRRFERELLDDLVDRRLDERGPILERSHRIGWPHRRPYVVLVMGRRRHDSHPLGPVLEAGIGEYSVTRASRALGSLPFQVRLLARRPGLCVIVHLDEHAEAGPAGESVADRLFSLDDRDPTPGARLVVGVGRPRTTVLALPDAFREAALAALMSPRIRIGAARVEHFANLGAGRLAAAVRDPARLRAIATDALEPLCDDGFAGARELLETLAALLDHNMSIAETAGELFFHYNTIRHRLGRLREILGERLESPAGRMSLALAVAALRVLDAESYALLQGQQVEAVTP